MSIPYYLKTSRVQLPELQPGQIRVVLAQEGPYLERRTSMYTTCAPTAGPLPSLEPHFPSCTLHCGKIPRTLIRTMLAFFQRAYQWHQGEAALVLLYHPERRVFHWYCPEQTVEVYTSLGRLRAYDFIQFDLPMKLPEGFVLFGDVHSHGDLGPYPSGIDKKDDQDGLHIIVGNVDRMPAHKFHVDFVMDGQRYNLLPEDILADVHCGPAMACPPSWLERVHLKQPSWWSNTSSYSYSSESTGVPKYLRKDYLNPKNFS